MLSLRFLRTGVEVVGVTRSKRKVFPYQSIFAENQCFKPFFTQRIWLETAFKRILGRELVFEIIC